MVQHRFGAIYLFRLIWEDFYLPLNQRRNAGVSEGYMLGIFIHIVLGGILGVVMTAVFLSKFTSNRLKEEPSKKRRLVIYLQHFALLLCSIGIIALVMRFVHDFQPRSFVNLIVLIVVAIVTWGCIWRALFRKRNARTSKP